jgi:hypothetical protein
MNINKLGNPAFEEVVEYIPPSSVQVGVNETPDLNHPSLDSAHTP